MQLTKDELSELWAELDKEYAPLPDYQDGDVTIEAFARRYKKSYSRACDIMRARARASGGRLLYLAVMMPDGSRRKVLRRA